MAYTKYDLLKSIELTEAKLGRLPTAREVREDGGPTDRTFTRHFGCYRIALEEYKGAQGTESRTFALATIGKNADAYEYACQVEAPTGEFDGYTSRSAQVVMDVLGIETSYIYPTDFTYDFWDEEFGAVNVLECTQDAKGDYMFDLTGNFEPDYRILVLYDESHTYIVSVLLIHFTKTINQSSIRVRDLDNWKSNELDVVYFNRVLRRMDAEVAED